MTKELPVKKKTREERHEEMQKEIDEINFEAAKAAAELRRDKLKSEKRKNTIKGIHREVDAFLDIFDGGALNDPVGDKKKKKKSLLDDPYGPEPDWMKD